MQDKNCEKTVNYGRMWFPEHGSPGTPSGADTCRMNKAENDTHAVVYAAPERCA